VAVNQNGSCGKGGFAAQLDDGLMMKEEEMSEQICTECRHINPVTNQYCGGCGQRLPLGGMVVMPAQKANPVLVSHRPLPAQQLHQLGQAALVSLATLAVDALLVYMRRRWGSGALTLNQLSQPQPATRSEKIASKKVTWVWGQRVTEVWKRGKLRERTIEQMVVEREQ